MHAEVRTVLDPLIFIQTGKLLLPYPQGHKCPLSILFNLIIELNCHGETSGDLKCVSPYCFLSAFSLMQPVGNFPSRTQPAIAQACASIATYPAIALNQFTE